MSLRRVPTPFLKALKSQATGTEVRRRRGVGQAQTGVRQQRSALAAASSVQELQNVFSLPRRIFLVLTNRPDEPGPGLLHVQQYAFREVRSELADDVLLTLRNASEIDVPPGLHMQDVAAEHDDRRLTTFEVSCHASERQWIDPANADAWERASCERPHDEVLRVLALHAAFAEEDALLRLPHHDHRRYGIRIIAGATPLTSWPVYVIRGLAAAQAVSRTVDQRMQNRETRVAASCDWTGPLVDGDAFVPQKRPDRPRTKLRKMLGAFDLCGTLTQAEHAFRIPTADPAGRASTATSTPEVERKLTEHDKMCQARKEGGRRSGEVRRLKNAPMHKEASRQLAHLFSNKRGKRGGWYDAIAVTAYEVGVTVPTLYSWLKKGHVTDPRKLVA